MYTSCCHGGVQLCRIFPKCPTYKTCMSVIGYRQASVLLYTVVTELTFFTCSIEVAILSGWQERGGCRLYRCWLTGGSGAYPKGWSRTWNYPYLSLYSPTLQALGCSHNCRQLTYGSFQLMYMSRDDHAVQLIEPWRPKRRHNIITAMLPRGWISTCKHQCTTVITTMWTESSWAFPGSYTADDLVRALVRWRTTGDKRAHNSTTNASFRTIIDNIGYQNIH